MKIAFVLVALLGCANASLNDDFHDFWSLVPADEIKACTRGYIANDADFEAIYNWLQSDFITIAHAVAQHPTYHALVDWLAERDCDISKVIDPFKALLGYSLPAAVPKGEVSADNVGAKTFYSWINDCLLSLVPISDIVALHKEKMQSSADWQEFIAYVSSEEMHSFVHDIGQMDEVQSALAKLANYGIDVAALRERIAAWLGWSS